jgi:mono/diheme cytochrome c family protein
MKRYIWLALLLSACNTTPINIFTQDNLHTQSFSINTKTDTTITTTEGIEVTIPANAISAATPTVTLLIKEALSLSDIIQAGLTTQTKDGILSSNGMFYINTKETSTILKPLQIKIPTQYADTAMRLYKGVADKDHIQWEAPEPLNVIQSETIQHGEVLFQQNCKSCHAVDKKLTAPALANVESRWGDRKLLFKFIRNSFSVLQDGDPYATCLYCEYNRMPKPLFPALTDDDIEGILAFINRETVRLKVKTSAADKTVNDSTRYYQRYYSELVAKRKLFIAENGSKVVAEIIKPEGSVDRDTSGAMKVSIPTGNAEYYQLTVEAYGWYNVDELLDKMGSVKSRLAVSMKGNYSQTINMYLVIPEYKVFSQGGLLDNSTEYGFYDGNGTIYLPQSKNAFIIAVGEEKGKIFYGQQPFITAKDQTIEISVTATSETEMKRALEKLGLDHVDISAKEVKHIDDLKQIEAEMERIRKVVPVCDCMLSDSSQAPPISVN